MEKSKVSSNLLPIRMANGNELYSTEQHLDSRKCCTCRKAIHLEQYISWELTEFCNIDCFSQYHKSLRSSCSTCLGVINENDYGKYHVRLENSFVLFCCHLCLEKYLKSVKICSYCEKTKSYSNNSTWMAAQLFLNKEPRDLSFCCEQCFKNFVRVSKICPPVIPHGTNCTVCNTNKSVTITSRYGEDAHFFCGTRCQIAFNFVRSQMGYIECKMCGDYFTMSTSNKIIAYENDIKISLCSKSCKNIFMLLKTELVICNWCQTKKSQFGMLRKYTRCILEYSFCCINCYLEYHDSLVINLKSCNIHIQELPDMTESGKITGSKHNRKQTDVELKKTRIYIMASKDIEQRNVATMCYVPKVNKSTATEVTYSNKSTQTDLECGKMLLPVPFPVYVPIPMPMFTIPVPAVLPIPMPIPIPIFLPFSPNSFNQVSNKIKDLNITPRNICEAELLKIAEIIAEDAHNNNKLKNDADDDGIALNAPYLCESTMQEICENLDIENALSTNTCEITKYEDNDEPPIKIKKCRESQHVKENIFLEVAATENLERASSVGTFKTDMRLDHTLGINAWKQWASKTLHLHKNLKFIKSEILHMAPEELSFALCLFVKELRKPNGDEYAPDTIYYLCLGIQYYLDINGRTDSIFFECIYDKFIECLDVFAKKFCTLYDDESHFIVTRVEEEHLWETKQLGCWSPYALLNTLVYFNTKYYCRSNVEEHMELSFFHIMKAHKKSKADNYFILRLYPRAKADDKHVYEQYQNKEDPLRCPVKLFEFYLSKCPETVKNSPNMLYLMPEKHVISESPVWYSTTPLPKEFLAALINRVKMIKEVNVALLSR